MEQRKRKRVKSDGRLIDNLIFCFAAASICTTLACIFGPTLFYVEQQHKAARDNVLDQVPLVVVRVDELPHEDLFQTTIKSCLPSESDKCKRFIPDAQVTGHPKVQRIALIAPPGDLSSALLNRLDQIAFAHNRLQQKSSENIEVVTRSSVPPYGYGKTHGLTAMVRLFPRPLVLEVTDALQYLLQPGETHKIITLNDLKAGLRMILRFHCRLSHVSAHTALLSVPLMDLLMDPGEVREIMQGFIAPNDYDNITEAAAQADDDEELEDEADDDQAGVFGAQESYGTQMLSWIQKVSRVNVAAVLDEVLLQEMALSKNLTAWPCQSFWAAGEPETLTNLSPLLQRLAASLSPDCDDEYASCFVKRDKCEAAGDAICAEE